jgi:chemotaxis protein MotB
LRRRRPLVSEKDAVEDLWPSFTDLISTTALILFVLVLLAYVQSLVSGKQLAAYRLQISASEEKLKLLEDRVRRTAAEVEAGQTRLRLSELELEKQRDVMAESNRELGDLRARLAGIAVLRVEVLERVKRSIESELGARSSANVPLVSIGDTGNIVINESLVFEYNSYAIKPEGRPLLDSLARGLGRLLADPAARDSIDAIVIQGHADDRGSAAFNRELSSRRANAVLNYLFQANAALEESYGNYFAAASYSEFRPLNVEKNEAAYQQNRRIEVSVVLRDANVRKVIDEYMQGVAPPVPDQPVP